MRHRIKLHKTILAVKQFSLVKIIQNGQGLWIYRLVQTSIQIDMTKDENFLLNLNFHLNKI